MAIKLHYQNYYPKRIKSYKKKFQEIADFTQMSTRELNNRLIEMQMDGLIIKLAGNAYISAR